MHAAARGAGRELRPPVATPIQGSFKRQLIGFAAGLIAIEMHYVAEGRVVIPASGLHGLHQSKDSRMVNTDRTQHDALSI